MLEEVAAVVGAARSARWSQFNTTRRTIANRHLELIVY